MTKHFISSDTMKYTVPELKLINKMVGFSNAEERIELPATLQQKQPHFCNIIDDVKFDPRCSEAHLFCSLFCSLALERAELLARRDFPPLPESVFQDAIRKIAQNHPELQKREETYPDRIRRHVLSSLAFDKDDSGWLQLMISGFLVTIENFSNE